MHEEEFLQHLTTSLSHQREGAALSKEISDLVDTAQRLSELRLVAAIDWGVVREAWGMTPSRQGVITLDDPDAQRTLAVWMEASANLERVQSDLRSGLVSVLIALDEKSRDADDI